MSTDDIMNTIKLFCILICILTVTTQVGFLIQKIIVDIRVILLSATISVLIFIILLATNVALAAIVSLIIYVSMLDRLLSRYDQTFGVVIASILGVGAELLIIINNFSYFKAL